MGKGWKIPRALELDVTQAARLFVRTMHVATAAAFRAPGGPVCQDASVPAQLRPRARTLSAPSLVVSVGADAAREHLSIANRSVQAPNPLLPLAIFSLILPSIETEITPFSGPFHSSLLDLTGRSKHPITFSHSFFVLYYVACTLL